MGLKQTLDRSRCPLLNVDSALFELTGDHHGGGQNNLGVYECKERCWQLAVTGEPLQKLECLPLEPIHLQACQDLDKRCLGGLWNQEQWHSELAEQRRPGMGLWRQSALVAMASGWLVVDELHITVVAVDPLQRRQGLGRLVLEALLSLAQHQGAERATLEVATTNTAAVALYRALGFRDAGIRRGYYRNGDDALIQWLRLATINDAEQGCG
jgi:ribosomal-protein-alanine N-acetyltransferase